MDDLTSKIDALEARFERIEPEIRAFIPEPGRFERLREEARELEERYRGTANRPPLFGRIAGIKDIFHVDGFETRAGSRLPPESLAGSESPAVTILKNNGALIAGKTVTTEFAYFGPGPTRNPRNPGHTPGGSSSGSAAAAAAGLCELALGTQTIGSVNRPAAFCGVFGFKPTYDRIPREGIIPLAPTFDHVGIFSDDFQILETAASVLCADWEPQVDPGKALRLGIPTGPYLEHAEPVGRRHYEKLVDRLDNSGHFPLSVVTFGDFDRIRERHQKVLDFEAAQVHRAWYDAHAERYHPKTRELIESGFRISEEEYKSLLEEIHAYRLKMRDALARHNLDAWITPAAPGTAPAGLESTGDPVMNLPWTQAGLPSLTVPAGTGPDGRLPLGAQLIGGWYGDERLLRIAGAVMASLES